MYNIISFCLFSFILLFYSCNESELVKNTNIISTTDSTYYIDSLPSQSSLIESNNENNDTLKLDFDDFQIKFPHLNTFSNNEISIKDTTELFLDLESTLDTFLIYWKNEKMISHSIKEQYQTVLSVQDEGPHIELYEWKNYKSEWADVDSIFSNVFLVRKITEEESSHFPKFTKQELVSYLTLNVDENWANKISNPEVGKWTEYFWIGVGIIRISIKIILNNGLEITKLLIIYPPMGC